MNLLKTLSSKKALAQGARIYGSEKLLLLSLIPARPDARLSFNKNILKYVWLMRLLITRGCGINARNRFNHTPLHLAIIYNCPTTVRFLFSGGVNIAINELDMDNWTLLHWAARCGHFNIIRLLLKFNVSMNAGAAYNPLFLAKMFGHLDCIALLQEN